MVEYITGTTVPILSGSNTTEQKDEVFHERDEEDEPLLFINEYSKYAYVEVDFITCWDYHLTESAYEEALTLLNRYQKIGNTNDSNNKTIWWGYGSRGISIRHLTIPLARAFAMELEELVMDSSNLTKNKNYDENEVSKQYTWD